MGDERLPRVQYPQYHVRWSEEDSQFVATCDWYPSMSYLAGDCVQAVSGLADLLLEVFGDEGLCDQRRWINRQRGYRE